MTYSDPREGCPRCGETTTVAYRGTFRDVYLSWRESRTLRRLAESGSKYACVACGWRSPAPEGGDGDD